MQIYSDAVYAGDEDNSKSTTGMFVKYNRCAITWLSKVLPIIAKSTCEAEYVGRTLRCPRSCG